MKTHQIDTQLMELLHLKEVNRIICDTNMGILKLRLRKGETNYHFTLDAVELPKDLNEQVLKLLFAEKPKESITIPEVIELPKKGRQKEVKTKQHERNLFTKENIRYFV